MRILTLHFGVLEIEPEQVLEFEQGPIPFVALRRYILLSREDEEPFQWLQSVEVPHLALVTLPVTMGPAEFRPRLGPGDQEWLGLRDGGEPVWLMTVAFGGGGEADLTPSAAHEGGEDCDAWGITANLLGPIALNLATRRGKQVIQDLDTSWARTPVPEVAQQP